jgi:putative ABC transport system permease protein
VSSVDRKSVVLFGLVLAACGLFVANAVSASVRLRRRELAVLSCVGWSRRRIGALVLGEVALVGRVAGGVAVALSMVVAGLAGIEITPLHAVMSIPVAIGVALVAAVVPAMRAARAFPGPGLELAVLSAKRGRARRSVLGMAMSNVARVPARSGVGVAALAVAVAGLTGLALISWQFHGQAQGTLLGDYISVQVRGVDVAAALVTAGLGVFAVADALYLNIRERAAEMAALRAGGWSDAELARVTLYEGALLGVAGATVGAALGMVAVAWFTQTLPAEVIAMTALIAAAGAALTTITAMIPAQLTRTVHLTAALAHD